MTRSAPGSTAPTAPPAPERLPEAPTKQISVRFADARHEAGTVFAQSAHTVLKNTLHDFDSPLRVYHADRGTPAVLRIRSTGPEGIQIGECLAEFVSSDRPGRGERYFMMVRRTDPQIPRAHE